MLTVNLTYLASALRLTRCPAWRFISTVRLLQKAPGGPDDIDGPLLHILPEPPSGTCWCRPTVADPNQRISLNGNTCMNERGVTVARSHSLLRCSGALIFYFKGEYGIRPHVVEKILNFAAELSN